MCTTHWPNSKAAVEWNEEVICQRNRKFNDRQWKCWSSHFSIRTVSSMSRRCPRRSTSRRTQTRRCCKSLWTFTFLENVWNCIWTMRGLIKQSPYPLFWLVGGLRSFLVLPTAWSCTVGLFPVSKDEASDAWKAVSRPKGNYEFSTYKFEKTFEKWATVRVRAVAASMAKMH